MSYIRCTSNPEGLYIWSDIDGRTYFSWHDQKGHQMVGIPQQDFDRFMKPVAGGKADYDIEQSFSCGPMSIREVWFDDATRKVVSDKRFHQLMKEEIEVSSFTIKPKAILEVGSPFNLVSSSKNVHLKVEISLRPRGKKRSIKLYLWSVTWEYVLANYRDELACEAANRERARKKRAKTKTKA